LDAATERDREVEEAKKASAVDMAELQKAHDEMLATLKRALQDEADAAAKEQERLENDYARLQEELKAEKAARAREITDLKSRGDVEYQQMEEKLKAEIERIRKSLTEAKENRENELLLSHQQEMDKTFANHKAYMEDFESKSLQDKASALEEAQRIASLNEIELRKELESDKQAALDALRKEMEAAAAILRDEHKRTLGEVHESLGATKQALADATSRIGLLEKQVAELDASATRREASFAQEKDQIHREHESAIRRERETHERAAIEAAERMGLEIKLLKDDFAEERHELEEQKREILKDLAALEERYMNRDSRPEDIERISQLEREAIEKDQLVEKTKEEMLYFKREMLNREDSYNKKFNSTPNVGVMQVIKSKDDPKSSKGNRKMNNPAMPPQGMGMGMGIGGVGGRRPSGGR